METEPADRYQTQKAERHQTITDLQRELDKQRAERKPLPKRVPIGDLPEPERFQRLLPERKHFLDTIKRIAYRAETAMASVMRERLAHDVAARHLCVPLNATETIFTGTDLRLVYEIVSM